LHGYLVGDVQLFVPKLATTYGSELAAFRKPKLISRITNWTTHDLPDFRKPKLTLATCTTADFSWWTSRDGLPEVRKLQHDGRGSLVTSASGQKLVTSATSPGA